MSGMFRLEFGVVAECGDTADDLLVGGVDPGEHGGAVGGWWDCGEPVEGCVAEGVVAPPELRGSDVLDDIGDRQFGSGAEDFDAVVGGSGAPFVVTDIAKVFEQGVVAIAAVGGFE